MGDSNKENVPFIDSPAGNTRSPVRKDSLVSSNGTDDKVTPSKTSPARKTTPPEKPTPVGKKTSQKKKAPPRKTTSSKEPAPPKKTTPRRKTAYVKMRAPGPKKTTSTRNAKGNTQKLTRPTRDLILQILDYDRVFVDSDYVPAEEENGLIHSETNEAPKMMPKQSVGLAERYLTEYRKRDPDVFNMYIYNRYPAWGLQEIIENHLIKFNGLMNSKPQDHAMHLWVLLSAFAHWTCTQGEDLYFRWFQLDDADRWRDTAGMIVIMIITTLNILEREGYFRYREADFSPIRNLRVVCTMLGEFVEACIKLTEEVACMDDNQDEVSWPYIFADYVQRLKAPIEKVSKKFFSQYGEDKEKLTWKPRAAIDRYGWKAKWRRFHDQYAKEEVLTVQRQTKPDANGNFREQTFEIPLGKQLGGASYDITKWPSEKRAAKSFNKVDPLDPRDPDNVRCMFPEEELPPAYVFEGTKVEDKHHKCDG